MKRIFFFLLLLMVTIFVHPIIGVITGLIIGITVKYQFYELIIIGIIIDVLLNSIYHLLFFQLPLYSSITLILFLSLSTIKSRLSFHA